MEAIMREQPPSDDLALSVLAAVLIALALLALVSACAPTVRLNPGECLVIVESEQVVTAGKDCTVKRYFR